MENKSSTLTDKTNIPREWRHNANCPKNYILGKPDDKMQTRLSLRKQPSVALISQIEPKKINETIEDESWVEEMQEELDQFERNQVWTLKERPQNFSIIGIKCFFCNKQDENRKVVRNKARLVEQGYSLQQGIDYDRTFPPAARLESIRVLLAYAYFKWM